MLSGRCSVFFRSGEKEEKNNLCSLLSSHVHLKLFYSIIPLPRSKAWGRCCEHKVFLHFSCNNCHRRKGILRFGGGGRRGPSCLKTFRNTAPMRASWNRDANSLKLHKITKMFIIPTSNYETAIIPKIAALVIFKAYIINQSHQETMITLYQQPQSE